MLAVGRSLVQYRRCQPGYNNDNQRLWLSRPVSGPFLTRPSSCARRPGRAHAVCLPWRGAHLVIMRQPVVGPSLMAQVPYDTAAAAGVRNSDAAIKQNPPPALSPYLSPLTSPSPSAFPPRSKPHTATWPLYSIGTPEHTRRASGGRLSEASTWSALSPASGPERRPRLPGCTSRGRGPPCRQWEEAVRGQRGDRQWERRWKGDRQWEGGESSEIGDRQWERKWKASERQ